MTDNLPEFDELNTIETRIDARIQTMIAEQGKIDRKRMEDMIFELLTMSYVYGIEVAGLDLEEDIPVNRFKMRESLLKPTAGKSAADRLDEYVKAANDVIKAANDQIKSGNDQVNAAKMATESESAALTGEEPPANLSDITAQISKTAQTLVYDLSRLAETEAHRVLNEAILDSALDYAEKHPNKNVTKTWATMLDDRVRETHDYLEGVTVPVDARFYTFDGDSAMAPGGFSKPQNSINCRCILRISK